jgi:hypothetical protein
MNLYFKPADGSGEEKLLLKTNEPKFLDRWTRDGRWLAYSSLESGSIEVWVRPFTPEAPAGTGAK